MNAIKPGMGQEEPVYNNWIRQSPAKINNIVHLPDLIMIKR